MLPITDIPKHVVTERMKVCRWDKIVSVKTKSEYSWYLLQAEWRKC